MAHALAAGVMLAAAMPSLAAPDRPGRVAPPPTESSFAAPWARMPAMPGGTVEMRPFPPRQGRNRCIAMSNMAGAQVFGDSALELSMRDGRRYRLFFARECPALSFYQGFYYRREKAGQICAGRDAIGARSGGECRIASIIELRKPRKIR
jgi:hypothetical protein